MEDHGRENHDKSPDETMAEGANNEEAFLRLASDGKRAVPQGFETPARGESTPRPTIAPKPALLTAPPSNEDGPGSGAPEQVQRTPSPNAGGDGAAADKQRNVMHAASPKSPVSEGAKSSSTSAGGANTEAQTAQPSPLSAQAGGTKAQTAQPPASAAATTTVLKAPDYEALYNATTSRLDQLERMMRGMHAPQAQTIGTAVDLNDSIRGLVQASIATNDSVASLLSTSSRQAKKKKLQLGDIGKNKYQQRSNEDYVRIEKNWLDVVATANGSEQDYQTFRDVPEEDRATVRRAIRAVLTGAALNRITVLSADDQNDLIKMTDALMAGFLSAEAERKEIVKDKIKSIEFKKQSIAAGLNNLQTALTDLTMTYAGVRDLDKAEAKGVSNDILKTVKDQVLMVLPPNQLNPLEHKVMEASSVTEIIQLMGEHRAYAQSRDRINKSRSKGSSADVALAATQGDKGKWNSKKTGKGANGKWGGKAKKTYLNINPANLVKGRSENTCSYRPCQRTGHFLKECDQANEEHKDNNKQGRRWDFKTGKQTEGPKQKVSASSHGGHGGATAPVLVCHICDEDHDVPNCPLLADVRLVLKEGDNSE